MLNINHQKHNVERSAVKLRGTVFTNITIFNEANESAEKPYFENNNCLSKDFPETPIKPFKIDARIDYVIRIISSVMGIIVDDIIFDNKVSTTVSIIIFTEPNAHLP